MKSQNIMYSLSKGSMLGMERPNHFDNITKPRVTPTSTYRFLIIDGHNPPITLEFVKDCDEANVKSYCLPPHSTYWFRIWFYNLEAEVSATSG